MKKTKAPKTTPLKTKRLILTAMTDEELRAKMEAEPDEHMKAAYGEMLAGCTEHPQARLWYTAWRILLRETGEAIGDLCYKGPAVNGEVELGYGIDEAYRGRGYATEAAEAAINWAFSAEEVYFVMAEAEADNAASLRVIEKLKFVPAGQGEEGPRFERERPASSWMTFYMCIGMTMGMSMGLIGDKMSIGMSLGMLVGLLLGLSMDKADNKKRAELRAAREKSAQ